MTSKHNAPYATTEKPKINIGDYVYSKTTRNYETVYGVRALKSSDGRIRFYYCFSSCSSVEELWHSQDLLELVEGYVRDRFGYCISLGDIVFDCAGLAGNLIVCKVDSANQRCFVKRSHLSRFGYWSDCRDLTKVA